MSLPDVRSRSKWQYSGAERFYTIDFVDDLDGDTISTPTWTLSSVSITKTNETNDATACTVKLSSTTPGVYTAAVSAATAGGSVVVDYLSITVRAIGS